MQLRKTVLPGGRSSALLLAATRGIGLTDLVASDLQSQAANAVRGGFNGTIGKTAVLVHNDALLASENSLTVAYGTSMPEGQEFREWDRDSNVNFARGIGFAVREARRFGMLNISIDGGLTVDNAFLAGYIAESANYDFDCGLLRQPKKRGESGASIDNLHVIGSSPEVSALVEHGLVVGRARNFARDLMNRPSSVLTTSGLAGAALEVASESGGAITAVVFGPEELDQEGFDLVLAISRGSNPLKNPPRVVILEYWGDRRGREAKGVVLVGKGVTHDLGGCNQKVNCADMHMDMGGAATMIATMQAIAALGLPVNVRMIIFCVENAVGRDMTISGAPIFSRLLGKTVVDINTDAEGRLALAECVAYAKKMWGDSIALGADAATLTGVQGLFFPEMSTVWGNMGDLAWQAHKAGLAVGDRVTMGFMDYACLTDLNKAGGPYDMGNIGTRKGPGGLSSGGSTVACEFVLQAIGGTIPWLHIDMAGAMERHADSGEYAQGGDAPNVITVIKILQDLHGFLERSGITAAAA